MKGRVLGQLLLLTFSTLIVLAISNFGHGQVRTETRFGESLDKLDIEDVRRALKEGADPNERYGGQGASALKRATTPLIFAHVEGRVSHELEEKIIAVLNVLFDAGASLKPHDRTILHGPAIAGASLVTKYLLDRGADPNGADREGNTPVILATKHGHMDIVSLLVNYGAKPLSPTVEAQIRFIAAANRGDLIAMRRELAKGATVNSTSPTGETALVEAIWGDRFRDENYRAVTELLRLGADPNLPGRFIGRGMSSPLHVAVFTNEHEFVAGNGLAIVEALLKGGAHVSSTTFHREQTPLHIAARLHNAKAAEILLKAGAKVMPRDTDGKTPLDYAEAAPVIELLKAYGAKER